MSNAGFSRKAIVSNMPEDIIPDVEEELRLEKEENKAMLGGDNLYNNRDQFNSDILPNEEQQKQINDLVVSGMNEQDAYNQVMGNAVK